MITSKDFKNINLLFRFLDKQHDFEISRFPYNYLMGALLIDKNKRSFGLNNYVKTHPRSLQNNAKKFIITLHAEIDAINKWNSNWKSTTPTLYILGYTRNGTYPISTHPCNNCLNVIKQIGIPRIVYSESDNNKDIKIIEKLI